MSTSAFADTIGISRSGLTHLLTGRNQPSLDVARKILAKFPEVSTEWLIMGMGAMFRPDYSVPAKGAETAVSDAPSGHPDENRKNAPLPDLFGEYPALDDSGAQVIPSETVEDMKQPVNEADTFAPASFVEDSAEIRQETSPLEPPISNNPVSRMPSEPSRSRKAPEPRQQTAPARRDRHAGNTLPERRLQKIIFFYDDHSFETYTNL